jgi:hypothetical protein
MKPKSLIGKVYKVKNNSYIKEVGNEFNHLKDIDLYNKSCVITSNVYHEQTTKKIVKGFPHYNKFHDFINVNHPSSGKEYRVLWNPGWIVEIPIPIREIKSLVISSCNNIDDIVKIKAWLDSLED